MLNRDYRKARRTVNAAQIDRLLASVPASTEERHRKRVLGYATTARRIDARITALRGELERALRAVDDAVADGLGDDAADEALRSRGSSTRWSASSRAWTPGCASPSAPSPTTRASSPSAKAPPRRSNSSRSAAAIGAAGPLAALAVEEHVDALVPERDQPGDRDGVRERLLVAPAEVRARAAADLDRPVRRLALVRAVGVPRRWAAARRGRPRREVEARGQVGLEQQPGARGLGHDLAVDLDPDRARALADVDAVERVARVAVDPLVLLVPGVERVEVEHHVAVEVLVGEPEPGALAVADRHRLAWRRCARANGIPGCSTPGRLAVRSSAPLPARPRCPRPARRRTGRRDAAPRRGSRACCRRSSPPRGCARTRFSVGS